MLTILHLMFAALGGLSSVLGPAQTLEATALTPGRVVNDAGRSGDVREYTVDLRAGELLELQVSQAETALIISLFGAGDDPLRHINLIHLAPLDAHLLFIAPESRRYRVRMRLGEQRVATAQYAVRVVALRAATEMDRARERCFVTLTHADRVAHLQQRDTFAQALDLLEEAAACWRDNGDATLESATLTSLAMLASFFSEFAAESAATYERLAELQAAAGDRQAQLRSLESAVREHEDDGRYDRARTQAVQMRTLATPGEPSESAAVSHVAFAELMLGNYAAARAAAASTIDIASRSRNDSARAFAEVTLAHLDELAGDDDAARVRFERVLQLNPGGRYNQSTLPIELGFLHLRRGEYEQAAARFSERLAGAATNVQREREAMARVGLGDVHLARGDRSGARALYEQANAALARGNTRYRCVALDRLGQLDVQDDRIDQAADAFAQMLGLATRMASSPCESQGRAGLTAVAARRGDLPTAAAEAGRVVELTERYREAVPSLESRALGFGALAPAFERAVDIQMRLAAAGDGQAVARALELSERGLARGLLDRMASAALEDRADVPPALAAERLRVREQWRAVVSQLQLAGEASASRGGLELLRANATALEVQLRDLDARVDAADPRRAGLIAPQPLELSRIQSLLDDDTQLIEYALGERQSYVWIVSATEHHGVPIAGRAAVDAAARLVREDLTWAPDAVLPLARSRRRALADLILAPVAPWLRARRLVVVATGALSLVPFAALPIPGAAPVAPMVSQFEIVHVPSATTLAALRALGAQRRRPTKTAMVVADPIYERSDTRAPVREEPATAERADSRTPLAASFRRLAFSRDEANAIAAMAAGEVTTLMDGKATRERVLGDALADYRVVHFATHGVVHPEVASLSSIVLSAVDDRGVARDPFVTLADIYDMRLNADVVVLSACDTAAGKNVPGEGPLGLARAFMYAGASRVVASLWAVNDRATAELMRRFYRGLLIEGLPAATALRAAQQQLAAIPQWRSPYYWGAFVIQGDWR